MKKDRKEFKELKEDILSRVPPKSGEEFNGHCHQSYLVLNLFYATELKIVLKSLGVLDLESKIERFFSGFPIEEISYEIFNELGIIQLDVKGKIVNKKLIFPEDVVPKEIDLFEKIVATGFYFEIFVKYNLYKALI